MKNALEAAFETWVSEPSPTNADRVITASYRVCKRWAHRRMKLHTSASIGLDDLLQQAHMGVWRAMNYHKKDGSPFEVYMTWWVRAYTIRYVHLHRSILRQPHAETRRTILARYSLLRAQLETEHPTGTDAEIITRMADALAMPRYKVQAVADEMSPTASLDAPHPETGLCRIDMVPSGDRPVDERYADAETIQMIRNRAVTVKPYWQPFAEWIATGRPEPMADVSRRHGFTRQRGGQIVDTVSAHIFRGVL